MFRGVTVAACISTMLVPIASFGQTATQGQRPTATSTTTWTFLTGVDYIVGDYGGTSDTTVIQVPLNIQVQADRLRLELTVPYLDIDGPGTSAGTGIVIPGSNQSQHRSGLGDITMGAAWLIKSGDLMTPSVEIAGNVKLPTAESGLGTDQWDYSVQANVYQNLTPTFILFGSGGYQWLGDPSGVNLKDGMLVSGGLNYKPSNETSIGGVVSYRQEYFQGLGDQASISPYIVVNFAGMWRLTGYGLLGLTDASPRIGGGLRVGFYN